MHWDGLLEPWIALRLCLAFTTTVAFALAAGPSWTALRRFDVTRASEGQLLLERRFELALAASKVAALLSVAGAFVTVLAAEAIYPQIRGAMCAYGLFVSAPDGLRALQLDALLAVLSLSLWVLQSIDAKLPRLELVRPIAVSVWVLCALSCVAWLGNLHFWLGLDRSVVASCCTLEIDDAVLRDAARGKDAPWLLAALAALASAVAFGSALWAWRRPRLPALWAAAWSGCVAAPLLLWASADLTAPHVYETPSHQCAFCLLRGDADFLGYPLALSLLVGLGLALGVLVAVRAMPAAQRDEVARREAPARLRTVALAWLFAAALVFAPVLNYLWLYEGRMLFR